jgi:hypothetical protein
MNALPACGLILLAACHETAAQRPPAQGAINFRRPVREYKDVRVGDMKVAVEKQLQAEAPDSVEKALERLKAERAHVLAALPANASKQLARTPFFLMYGPRAKGGGRNNGLEYFQKGAAGHHPELDRRWSDAIVIYSAENYVQISNLWAQKALLHEFAHSHIFGSGRKINRISRAPGNTPETAVSIATCGTSKPERLSRALMLW